jgi:hypothetical protein
MGEEHMLPTISHDYSCSPTYLLSDFLGLTLAQDQNK